MLKIEGAQKLGGNVAVILYYETKEKLYYSYLYSFGTMLYGENLNECIEETLEVLKEYKEMLDNGKIKFSSLKKKESFSKTIQLYYGLLKTKIGSIFSFREWGVNMFFNLFFVLLIPLSKCC